MKKIIMVLIVLSSISANAETCMGTAPTSTGWVTPVHCYETAEKLEGSTLLKGVFMDAGDGIIVGFKTLSNKNKICKGFGFESYVKQSAVVEKRDIWTSSQGMLVPGPQKVITKLECR